jgi:hypothetical protein
MRPTFDKRDNKRILTNQKLYSTIFKILSSGSDPFVALALFSPPLASSTKTDQSWPLNPIATPKSSIKSKKAIRA